MHATQNQAVAKDAVKKSGTAQNVPASKADLPMGRIKDLKISRMINIVQAIKLKAMAKKVAVFTNDIIIHL